MMHFTTATAEDVLDRSIVRNALEARRDSLANWSEHDPQRNHADAERARINRMLAQMAADEASEADEISAHILTEY